LLLIIVLTGVIRYGLIDVPFERDEGEYAYAGQLVLQAIQTYQEICDMKLPGIYAAYALCLVVFGDSHQGIHTALLIINALTIIIVFLLAKHLTNLLCAVISAACFALLLISQAVQGVFANTEHFVIIFALGCLLVLLRSLATESMLKFLNGLMII
jgi:4-amino-4-deoxy-L-arabinose transferase-like glycosyltransferase